MNITAIASFPYPVLSPVAILPAQPTFETLKRLQEEMDANSSSIETNLGNGLTGHLVLTMAPAVYQALPEFVEFVVPINPGVLPIYAPNATDRQLKITRERFDVALKAFETYKATSAALKKQLLAACPSVFYDALREPIHGFMRVSVRQILDHLWITFGRITNAMYTLSMKTLMQPFWVPSESIETLFTAINGKLALSIAFDSPCPDKLLAEAVYLNVDATGVYEHWTRQWRAKPDAEKTYLLSQAFFRTAYADETANRSTAASQGYQGAHSAIKADTPSKEMDQATAFALALTSAVKEVMKEYKPPVAEPVNNKRQKRNPSTTPSSTPDSGTIHYCWIHGESRSHKGSECGMRIHFPGFQESATLQDKKGGSTYVLPKK